MQFFVKGGYYVMIYYLGQTGRQIEVCFRQHLRRIKLNNPQSSLHYIY